MKSASKRGNLSCSCQSKTTWFVRWQTTLYKKRFCTAETLPSQGVQPNSRLRMQFQILALPQTSECCQANSLFHSPFINHKLETVFFFLFLTIDLNCKLTS